MAEQIAAFFVNMPKEWVTLIIALIPIAELRGAIPWALASPPVGGGLTWQTAYLWAVVGNLMPVIPLLLFFERTYIWLNRYPIFERFFTWLFARTRKRGKVVEKYKALGLILFVGIPLPVTGAWTGTLAAFLFGIKFKQAFPCIVLGVMLAGAIVTLASLGVISLF
ncbi:small multi-drug export protein [candidate division KSB1 bacterium]|nr:small multi-drug export protein [candidate division KSB1 bacterium]